MGIQLYSHPDRPLIQHLEAVAGSAEAAIASIPWTDAALGTTLRTVARLIGLYHDVGKGTTYFQQYLAWNVAKARGEQMPALQFEHDLKSHALLSAVTVYLALQQYLESVPWGNREQHDVLAAIGFYVVRQHHQDLNGNLAEELRVEDTHDRLHRQVGALQSDYFFSLPHWNTVVQILRDPALLWDEGEILPLIDGRMDFQDWIEENGQADLMWYIVADALFSALLEADKLDASHTSIPPRRSVDPSYLSIYRQQHFGHDAERPMDALRDWAYQVSVKDARDSHDHHICALSLPTGSGKTLAALGWALTLREQLEHQRGVAPRIIYALPFISIVDQNFDVFRQVFSRESQPPTSDLLLAHTHLSDPSYHMGEDSCFETSPTADQQTLLIEGWESEVVVTTFVQLFETFFSGQNRIARRFDHTAGSIIILDEVQAFPHQYWLLFQQFAETMARMTDTYFLLCTATQPAIFAEPHELAPVLPPNIEVHAPRTELIWKADQGLAVDEFVNIVVQNHRQRPGCYLLVMNTIGCAEQVYHELQNCEGRKTPMMFLSTYLCPEDRLARIHALRDHPHAVEYVISTQLIEAGVDIDTRAAYRDMAPLDSIIQVAGRVNRSGDRSTEPVTVVSLHDDNGKKFANYIYDAVLRDKTERLFAGVQGPVLESAYADMAHAYYEAVGRAISHDDARCIVTGVARLDFSQLERFRLIDDDRLRVSVFVELNDDATEILEQYRQCREQKDPWQRRSQWLSIKNRFLGFVVNVPATIFRETGLPLIEGSKNFYYLPAAQRKEFYDADTGFNQGDSSARIW